MDELLEGWIDGWMDLQVSDAISVRARTDCV